MIQIWTERRHYRYKRLFAPALDYYPHRTADPSQLLQQFRLEVFTFTSYLGFAPHSPKMPASIPAVSFRHHLLSQDHCVD